jgi:hypothetical protein
MARSRGQGHDVTKPVAMDLSTTDLALKACRDIFGTVSSQVRPVTLLSKEVMHFGAPYMLMLHVLFFK